MVNTSVKTMNLICVSQDEEICGKVKKMTGLKNEMQYLVLLNVHMY